MGCQRGHPHRDEGALGCRHRADGRQELVRPGAIDDAQDRLAALRQLEGPLPAILLLRSTLDESSLHQPVN